MRRTHLWAWAVVVCLFSAPMVCAQSQPASDGSSGSSSGAVAAVPRLIKFSGAVRDARGEPLTGVAVRLTFAVYSEQQGGAALWIESQVAQLDEQGHYNVLLGATRADGLPVELFPAGKARWLGVQVEGRDEDARVLLVSVPYALKAEDAAMLGGRRASDFVLGEQLKEEVRTQVAAQTPGIATQAVEMLVSNPPIAPAIAEGPSTFTCATTGNCVTLQQNGTGRAMSSSAISSTDVLFVQQTGTGYGLWALAPGNVAVFGQITGSAGTSYGVKGQTTSTTGAGVFGYNLATTGLAYGVLGQTKSTEGTAFFGRAVATTGATIGLRGHADSTSGTGIMGQATATSGTTTGILARVFSVNGTALIVDNTQGGKLLSGQVNGVEKLGVDGSGNLTTSGSVTATSFSGGGTLSGTQLISTVASGTAPLSVTSNTLVPSLNADLLDGLHAASFQPAGVYATLGANTFTDTQTISSGNLNLPATAGSSVGVINLGGSPFAHGYGAGNTFLGTNGGNFTTTGSGGNTAIGAAAFYSNTTGSYNTATGYQALYSNTTGSLNTASGWYALRSNTVANGNTASGYLALNGNTDGWYNTAMGRLALSFNCTGVPSGCTAHYNTALGDLAGVTANNANANVSGAKNTFLGAYSGPGTPTQLTNATAVGYRALVSASNSLVLGATGAYAVNVGIGTEAPLERLDVVGNIQASGSVTASSFVGPLSGIASDLNCTGCVASSEVSFNYAASASQGGDAANALLLNGFAASAFQPAGSYATLGANTFTNTQTISSGNLNLPATAGSSAGVINLGGSPFAHGYGTLNTFLGVYAGNFTATGSSNTATGYSALNKNTSGNNNTATGNSALFSNTEGTGNTATGASALQSNTSGFSNTASGVFALQYNTTASNNVALGSYALAQNCYGVATDCYAGSNTAVGYLAGVTSNEANANVTGDSSTFLGAYSGPGTSTQLSNATAIGYRALVSASNSLVLGGTGGYAVNVGIGTPTPATPLHVATGDIYASQAASGVVVKSPDGTKCARIGIDNSGALSVTALTCP